jgi:adenylate cyclase
MMQWTQSPILIRVRLAASLVLMFFAATHFLNHALGLISLDAMEAGRKYFLAFWRNNVFQFLLPLALLSHAVSSIGRLMFRQSWSFSTREKIKIFSGLAIPLFLFLHICGTRLQWWVYGYNDTYAFYLYHNFRGGAMYFLLFMSLLIWVHAYYGVTDVLNLKSWFERYRTRFALLYTAIPILGLAGVISAANQVFRLAENPEWLRKVILEHGGWPQRVVLTQGIFYLIGIGTIILLIASLFLLRVLLLKKAKSRATIRISYADGPEIRVTSGITLLEASLTHRIEHTHVCGGNGRCSTCRVRVLTGSDNLSPAEGAERSVLKKIGAENDVRLACQARVSGEVKIAPLIGASQATHAGAAALLTRRAEANGMEREVVVFFSDLKGFTSFSENKLPYDVVFVLNQYFRGMGKIIEQHDGFIDKFIGDGIMAIFGLNGGIQTAAQNALKASLRMNEQLKLINEFLSEEIETPLEIRIGLHAGNAIVGELGYGGAAHVTAIGDVVNTASRLEHANKKLSTWLLFSETVAAHAGLKNIPTEYHARVQLRGKTEPLAVYGIPKDGVLLADFY